MARLIPRLHTASSGVPNARVEISLMNGTTITALASDYKGSAVREIY